MAILKMAERYPFLPTGIVSRHFRQLDYRSAPGVVPSNKISVAPTRQFALTIKRVYSGTKNKPPVVENGDIFARSLKEREAQNSHEE